MNNLQKKTLLFVVLCAFAFSFSFTMALESFAGPGPSCCQYYHPCGIAYGHEEIQHGGGTICTGCEDNLNSCHSCPSCP